MNLFTAIALAVATLTSVAFAEEFLVNGGRSANGLYEVRLVRTPNYDANKDGSEYLLQIWSASDKKALLMIDGSGFRSYSNARSYCKALWSPSNSFVAFTDRVTRHTNKMYVVNVTPDAATQLEIPNYTDNALGRVNATRFDFACASTPKAWHSDRLSVQLYFTANGRHSYTSDVTLHAVHLEHSPPSLVLETVTQPKEGQE